MVTHFPFYSKLDELLCTLLPSLYTTVKSISVYLILYLLPDTDSSKSGTTS